MQTLTKIYQDEMSLVMEMQRYVDELKQNAKKDPKRAEQDAREALIRTGVASNDGIVKKKIVSWE